MTRGSGRGAWGGLKAVGLENIRDLDDRLKELSAIEFPAGLPPEIAAFASDDVIAAYARWRGTLRDTINFSGLLYLAVRIASEVGEKPTANALVQSDLQGMLKHYDEWLALSDELTQRIRTEMSEA